jgi:hypothetical protein
MFHQNGGSVTQNCSDVRLIKRNSYFDKPVGGSNLQLLVLSTPDRMALLNSKDCPASTPHYITEFAFCFRQTCHVMSLQSNAKKPAVSNGRRGALTAIALPGRASLRRPLSQFK